MAHSLRKQLKKEIIIKCPNLSVRDKDHWYYIAHKGWSLFIFLIYLILLILSFSISFPDCMHWIIIHEPQELNNSSNGILASIVGITMVIIGFIFTELKSKSFVDFKFFSERTFIFPIFYSSLANILMMILISLLSDTFIDNEHIIGLNNAIIFSHYMIVINIILIIIIFIRVARFMDYQPVFDSYKLMVIKKAKIILLQENIFESFKSSISKVFLDNEINTIYTRSPLRDPQKAILINKNKKGMLHDIDIKKLIKEVSILKKMNPTEDFQYSPFLLLGKTINENAEILYANETVSINLRKTESIKVKVYPQDDEIIYKNYLDNIHEKYIEAVRSNNANQAIDYLSIYQELYDLYCQTNKNLR
jgi:hypothetical protein